MVKDHAQQTQRRVNVFASQCADREFESSVYEYAYNVSSIYLVKTIARLQAAILMQAYSVDVILSLSCHVIRKDEAMCQ